MDGQVGAGVPSGSYARRKFPKGDAYATPVSLKSIFNQRDLEALLSLASNEIQAIRMPATSSTPIPLP